MGYRYIGSKARVADDIAQYLGAPPPGAGRFIDAFSGTGVVAGKAADLGWDVAINDKMQYAAVLSEARLLSEADVPFAALGGYAAALEALASASREGFIWREYSPASAGRAGVERRYFTEENAARIDGASALIHGWRREGRISDREFSLLLATLISAVNDVANIAGTYGCFLSKWTSQALGPLTFKPLSLRKRPVRYEVSTLDVFEVESRPADVVYLDPPYTKRQYAAYYHILETLVKGDEPSVEGVSGLRPWRDSASVFCYKVKALRALVGLAASQGAGRVLISYSNDGHIQLDQLAAELEKTGRIEVVELGSIGRYRPNQTASMNRSDVKEYLIDYKRYGGTPNEQAANAGADAAERSE